MYYFRLNNKLSFIYYLFKAHLLSLGVYWAILQYLQEAGGATFFFLLQKIVITLNQ